MQQNPRKTNEPIVDLTRWRRIFFYAGIITATTIGAVYFSHYVLHPGAEWDAALCNNILFFSLISNQLFHVFNMGSISLPFWRTEVFRNRFVWLAVGTCVGLVVLLNLIPPVRAALSVSSMSIADWGVTIGAGFLAMLIIRAGKHLSFFQDKV